MGISVCAVCGTPHADVTIGTPRQEPAAREAQANQHEAQPLHTGGQEFGGAAPTASKGVFSTVFSAMFCRCSKSSTGPD
eukprot:2461030-Amphidinium_carterae.1